MSTCRRMWTDRQVRSMADDTAKTLIEAGQTENAKPIYVHPINLSFKISDDIVSITMLIFNNDSTPFTFATFRAWCYNLQTELGISLRIATTGGLTISNVNYPANYIALTSGSWNFWSFTNTVGNNSIQIVKDTFDAIVPDVFNDGVNKIN